MVIEPRNIDGFMRLNGDWTQENMGILSVAAWTMAPRRQSTTSSRRVSIKADKLKEQPSKSAKVTEEMVIESLFEELKKRPGVASHIHTMLMAGLIASTESQAMQMWTCCPGAATNSTSWAMTMLWTCSQRWCRRSGNGFRTFPQSFPNVISCRSWVSRLILMIATVRTQEYVTIAISLLLYMLIK